MKKYKNLVPVLLVLLMAFGVYHTFSSAAEQKDAKKENLALARENREKGVIQDALAYYQAALELEEDFSVELEIGEMLKEAGMVRDATDWGEHLVDKFPKEDLGYTFLLEQYIEEKDYEECFLLNDKAENQECANEGFRELMASIAYVYEYEFDEYEEVTTFCSGMAAAKPVEKTWRLLKDSGSSTASGYQQAGFFNGEVMPVRMDEGWMYVTADGSKKIDVSGLGDCEELGMLSGEVFVAKCGGTYGYYDTQLTAIAEGFEYASAMNQGIGAACKEGQWFLLNEKGDRITETAYQDIVINVRNIACANERAWVSEDGLHYYMVDLEGNKIEGSDVDGSKGFSVSDSLAAVKRDGKWGYMDKNGAMVLEPRYEDARSFCNGYAAVCQGSVWGFLNQEGEMAIDPSFDDAKDFSSGSVFVKRDDSWVMLKLYRSDN